MRGTYHRSGVIRDTSPKHSTCSVARPQNLRSHSLLRDRYPPSVTPPFDLESHELLIIRHGQSTWNAERRWQGQANPPLSQHGREEAFTAAGVLHGMGLLSAPISSSDLQRAADTAAALASAIQSTVQFDVRLRERHAGAWEGHTHEEIEAQWPGWLAERRRPEGFEADESIRERVFAALDDAQNDARQVVVSHGGVMRLIARSYGEDNLIPRNLDAIRISWPPQPEAHFEIIRTLDTAETGMEGTATQRQQSGTADADRV